MGKIKRKELLKRIEALEEENRQDGQAMFMTLKCIQGNRLFTKDMRYSASVVMGKVLATHNFGGRVEMEVNTNIFGGYKQTDRDNTAVFMIKGEDEGVEEELTGSDLCRAMLKRGDKVVLCAVGTPESVSGGSYYRAITEWSVAGKYFTDDSREIHLKDVTPINNRGEPLKASEVGL